MRELMTKRTSRGMRSSASLPISSLLLVALLLQVTPFVIPLSVPSVDAPADGVSQYFAPLQVCNDLQGPGILLNDIPWLPPSPQIVPSLLEGVPFFAAVCQSCREGFFPSPYRPPRPLFSLS